MSGITLPAGARHGRVKTDWESFRNIKPTYDKKEFKRKIEKIYPDNHTSYDLIQLMLAHIQDLENQVRGLNHKLGN